VPIAPRCWAWVQAEYGDCSLTTRLEKLPDVDFMYVVDNGTPNYIDRYPEEYNLPEVKVDQKRYQEGNYEIVERTFHTPAGDLSDRTKIPPVGREYGVSPDRLKTEYLVKCSEDLAALRYILPEINTNFDHVHEAQQMIGDRGVVLVEVLSALDHQASDARGMQNLLIDYYDDRELFDALLDIFHQRSLMQIKAAMEGGAGFILGSWFFNSLSSGWSPAIFAEVFVPQIREHVELTHSYGGYYDYYDDGKLMGSMEMIVDAGVDVLETCTPPPVGDFDLAYAKERIGEKTTIKGYIEVIYVMERGTPELVEKTVREAMEIAKPNGGFIIGSSDSFREGTPMANIVAYFEACKKYGTYH